MIYTLEFKTDNNDTLQSSIFPSLAALIMQVKADFDNCVLTNIDPLVEATYRDERGQKQSAMTAVLHQLKWCKNPADIRDQITYRLAYLAGGC